MMYILEKKNLDQTLNDWSSKYEVIAPQIVDGISQFLPLGPNSELALNDSINTRYPPKSYYLPQSEVMLKYNPQLHKLENVKILPEQRIIFGIRPCDAYAITLLDTVFDTEEYRDPYWTSRRSSSIIIGLGCNVPHSTCFCTTVGNGPFNHDGMDALMTELDDLYFIEVFSKKGKAIFSELPSASEEQQKRVKRHQTQVAENMTIAFETDNLKQTLDNLWVVVCALFYVQHVFASILLTKFKEMSAFAIGIPVCLESIHRKHPGTILARLEQRERASV